MEISRLCQCYIIYVIISSVSGKTFSINEALAASEASTPIKRVAGIENRRTREPIVRSYRPGIETFKLKKPLRIKDIIEEHINNKKSLLSEAKLTKKPQIKFQSLAERIATRKSLLSENKLLKSPRRHLESIVSREEYEPRNRKAYQIYIPLKPLKLKPYRPLYKRRNQSVKREASETYKYGLQYTPLLKNIRILFNDLLRSGSRELSEKTEDEEYKKTLSYSTKNHDITCHCTAVPKQHRAKTNSKKETIIASETKTIEVTVPPPTTAPATTSTDHTPSSNFSNIGSDPIIPLLPTGNTSSVRGNHIGVTEGSSATRYGSDERNLTRDYGDGEHNTEQQGDGTGQGYDQEDTGCSSGDGSSCIRNVRGNDTGTRIFGNSSETSILSNRTENVEIPEIFGEIGGETEYSNIEDKVEVRRNETEILGNVLISEPQGGGRGPLPAHKEHDFGKPIQSVENNAYSHDRIGEYLSSHKRVFNRSSASAATNQRVFTKNPAGLDLNGLPSELMKVKMNNTNDKQVVMIIDGYSVARDKNGNHKIVKKSIKINT